MAQIHKYMALATRSRFKLLSFLAGGTFVLFITASLFFQFMEFFIEMDDYLTIAEMIACSILATLLFSLWYAIPVWQDYRKNVALKHLYAVRIEPDKHRIHLGKEKIQGFVNADRTYAVFTKEGLFLSIGFWSHKTKQLIGTITNEDYRWNREDITEISNKLQSTGMKLQRKVKTVGINSGGKTTIKSSSLNENTVLAPLSIGVVLGITFIREVFIPYALLICGLCAALYVAFLFNQKDFIITPKYLIVKNRWIPFYQYKLPLSDIASAEFVSSENNHLDISTVNGKRYKFYSKVSERNLMQIAFLVDKKIN